MCHAEWYTSTGFQYIPHLLGKMNDYNSWSSKLFVICMCSVWCIIVMPSSFSTVWYNKLPLIRIRNFSADVSFLVIPHFGIIICFPYVLFISTYEMTMRTSTADKEGVEKRLGVIVGVKHSWCPRMNEMRESCCLLSEPKLHSSCSWESMYHLNRNIQVPSWQ